MSGKGKKKVKATVMSLGEFHANTATSTGSSEPASQLVRINWADEMEKLDDGQPGPAAFVFDRSALPTATKSLLQQDVNLENVPTKPPFTAYLSNISFEADEDMIRAFFKDLKIETVRLPSDHGRPKGYGYVDFDTREGLIAALSKNEQPLNNRPLKVSLEKSSRGDRETGGRGGFNNQQQDGPQKSDEADWRRREPDAAAAAEEEKPAFSGYQSYQNRQGDSGPGRYQNRGDRDQQQGGGGGSSYQPRGENSYQRGGGSYQRGGGGGGGAWQVAGGGRGGAVDQESNRRPYNSYQNKGYGDRDQNRGGGYGGDREQNRGGYGGGDRDRDQNRGYGGDRDQNRRPYRTSDQGPREGNEQQASSGSGQGEGEGGRVERPKLVLAPRTVPVEETGANATASSIFGGAKPVNTAAREREIEERLKEKAREAAEKERLSTSETNPSGENPEEEAQQTTTSGTERSERSHKVSTTSADSQGQEPYRSPPQHQNRSNQDQYNKPRQQYNKDSRGNNRGGLQQSGSFTSPPQQQQQNPSSSSSYQQRSHEKPKEFVEAPRPSENAWKTKPASNLFSGDQEQGAAGENADERGNNAAAPARSQGPRQPGDESNRRPYNPNNTTNNRRTDSSGQTRPQMNRDNKDKRPFNNNNNGDRNKQFGRGQRGDRQFNNSSRGGGQGGPGAEPRMPRTPQHLQQQDEISDINVGNKFSHLQIDVEEDNM